MSYNPNRKFNCVVCTESIGPVTNKGSLWCSYCNVWQHLCQDVKTPVLKRVDECERDHPWLQTQPADFYLDYWYGPVTCACGHRESRGNVAPDRSPYVEFDYNIEK